MYICAMKVYIGIDNGVIRDKGHTSLEAMCRDMKVSYDSAVRGKRVWVDSTKESIAHPPVVREIKEVDVEKIKGRGKKSS